MSDIRQWSVEFDVREDAASVFVPAAHLPDAAVGDVVTITSGEPSVLRRGRIADVVDDAQRGQFFTVSLD